ASFMGSAVAISKGVRAYISGDDGIRSFISQDGRRWKPEPGLRLAGAWDPAVIKLRDGSYMMIYCASAETQQPTSTQLVSAADYMSPDVHDYGFDGMDAVSSEYSTDDLWGGAWEGDTQAPETAAYEDSIAGIDDEGFDDSADEQALEALADAADTQEYGSTAAPSGDHEIDGPADGWRDSGRSSTKHANYEGPTYKDGYGEIGSAAERTVDTNSRSSRHDEPPYKDSYAEQVDNTNNGTTQNATMPSSGRDLEGEYQLSEAASRHGPGEDSQWMASESAGTDADLVLALPSSGVSDSYAPPPTDRPSATSRLDEEDASWEDDWAQADYDGGNEEPIEEYDRHADADSSTSRPDNSGLDGPLSQSADAGTPRSESTPEPGEANLTDIEWPTSGPEDWPEQDALAFVPAPNFEEKIEYLDWYSELALQKVEDNAFDAYAVFIPGPGDWNESQVEWPELNDMFNDREYEGAPAPWDPQEHPEWEESNREAQELLGLFREATTHEGYSPPVMLSEEEMDSDANEYGLMLGIRLGSLGSHRRLGRATLADAWRMDDGEVSPQRLLEAWRTALRDARHLAQGATLIEELVAMAMRRDVQYNARWALKHVEFSAEQLESALKLLMQLDGGYRDPTLAIVGEHAMSMDTLQYVFMPEKPGGTPRINMDNAKQLLDMTEFTEELRAETLERLARMTPDDIQTSIEATDACYRELAHLFRTGYPEVRGADIQKTLQRYIRTNVWTELLLPDLTRVYVLRARDETSRRGTQLTYAVHLFKARNGRWPNSLDELPGDHPRQMRIDPFTGKDFAYRVDDNGPKIYSLSENAVDDGGVHSPRWDDELTKDTETTREGAGARDAESPSTTFSDDFVFWPPQPRPTRK
ncbi:MAG: hypothetical protein JSU63_07065, partial [Phycisphaerales bacterium]